MKEPLTSGLLNTLFNFVKWVDTWKKLLIIILMAGGGAAGAVAWEYRSQLIESVIRATELPKIDESKLESEISAVMRETDALALVVWSVSMDRNYRETIYVRLKEQKVPSMEGVGDVVLRSHTRETMAIISLLDNGAACWPYEGTTSIGMEAVRAGIKWACATKLPASYGSVAGILAVGFPHRPEHEDFIKIRLIQAAEAIMH